jgi:hypothetical protein
MTEIGDRSILAEVSDYDGLIAALRARADELKITRLGLDAVSGLESGYSAKLLSSVPVRQLGRVSLGPILGAMGLALVVVEDLTALRKIERQLEKRLRPLRNAGSEVLAQVRKKQRAFSLFRESKEAARLVRAKQIATQSPLKRSRIARKAARVRWRRQKV